MRSAGLGRDLLGIAAFAIVIAAAALSNASGVWPNLLMMALYVALLASAWNILAGYGGQFSFGHALFFGSGAYAQVLAQTAGGLNAWLALGLAAAAAVVMGAAVGGLSFRYGLKGSYFALVSSATYSAIISRLSQTPESLRSAAATARMAKAAMPSRSRLIPWPQTALSA